MKEIDLKSKKSIYQQIVDGIKEDIVSGALAPKAKLPSVRDLSSKLTVNPNTIQKAYKELEATGWIYSVSGLGNFVSESERKENPLEIDKLYASIEASIKQLRFLGVDEKNIMSRIEKISKGGGEND